MNWVKMKLDDGGTVAVRVDAIVAVAQRGDGQSTVYVGSRAFHVTPETVSELDKLTDPPAPGGADGPSTFDMGVY